MLTLHRDLDHAHADTNMSKRQPRRYRRFSLFWYFPPAGWGGGAQQQQQKSAAAAAAAARTRGNEINKYRNDTE
jgi:hypothetical protein